MKSSRFACGVIVAFIFVAAALNGCGTKNEQPTMPISYTVHGTVLEQGTDTPISEASVIIDHMGMLTDAEGHFDAMGMSSGTHTVHATKEGYDTYSGEFQVSAAPESRQLSITMKRSVPPEQYRDVTINVHSQSNAESVPIANAIVTIADRADTTDQQGNAHLTQVPFGTQQMRIERYGLVLKEQPIDVDSETPDTVPIAVETTGDEGIELLVQTTQLSASLNRLNDPNVTPLTNMTPDQFAHEAIAGAREASNGLANIVKLENIDATVWKLENGRVIRVSNAARAAALGFKIVDYLLDGTDSFSGAVKIRATDGTITYFVQPNGGPMISAGSRLNDDERRRLLADNYGAPRVTNSLDELHQTIDGVIEVTNDACAIYSLLVIFTDGTTLPLAVTACSVSGKIQLVDAVWHVVDTFMNDYHDVGLYVRKPNFDGDPTVPLICITPIPNPNPPPFDRLFIHPELVITKLGHPAIQFQAVAHDESGNYSDVTDIVTWSMEDLTGQLVHGLFTPWQTGTGRIVITLDIAPQLNAHADVTVYPEQATCSFVVVFPELNHPGTYDITCHIGDLIPEFLQNIKLAYGDGSSDTIPPSELNYLSDFTRTHTYTANGTYQLVLNVTDVDGGTCESTHNLDVTIPANVPPVSHPDCPGTGRINVPIPVTNNATDSDGTVTSYRFRTESADFTQNEKTVNITFGSPGSKLVYMSAQDNDGDWGTEAYCTIEVGTESPTADFTFVPSDPHTDETITFTATVSDDDTPAADLQVRWQWETNSSWTDWSTTKTTSHAYSTAGTKHVTVEVKDQWDLTGTSSHDVVVVSVNHAPTASITPCPLSGHTNTLTCAEFGYADADSDPMADGELDWGDGTVEHYGADGSFCHTYLTTGS